VWEDFRCTFCFDFTTVTEPQLITKYIQPGQVKLVYHDLIVIDSGASQPAGITESRDAANAGYCANDQGKFWPFHDWLFTNQSPVRLRAPLRWTGWYC